MRWGFALILMGCAGADSDASDATGSDEGVIDALMAVVGRDGMSSPMDGSPSFDAQPDVFIEGVDAARDPDMRWRDPDSNLLPPGPDAAAPLDAAAPMPDLARPPPDAGRPECVAEACNGADDDCDTRIDEDPVCGDYIEQHCTLTLGWADDTAGPRGVSPSWSTCPAQDRQMGGNVRCTRTRRDGRFVRLDFDGDVDDNDQLAVALHCGDAALPDVSMWIQTHCALYLGHADDNGGRAGGETWGACPPAPWSDAVPRCTSTGLDGMFRAMRLAGDVDGSDDLGIAWICRDPAEPQRALAAQAAAQVQLVWSDDNGGANDGADTWGFACPGRRDGQACTATLGDGRYHQIDLGGDVDDNDDLGIALKRR